MHSIISIPASVLLLLSLSGLPGAVADLALNVTTVNVVKSSNTGVGVAAANLDIAKFCADRPIGLVGGI